MVDVEKKLSKTQMRKHINNGLVLSLYLMAYQPSWVI